MAVRDLQDARHRDRFEQKLRVHFLPFLFLKGIVTRLLPRIGPGSRPRAMVQPKHRPQGNSIKSPAKDYEDSRFRKPMSRHVISKLFSADGTETTLFMWIS